MLSQHLDEPDFDAEIEESEPERPRDRKVDGAKDFFRQLFKVMGDQVFYKRQLQVWWEDTYFHWITDRALTELVAEGSLVAETEELPIVKHITFFRSPGHRFWKRQAKEIKELVTRFSDPEFTKALGIHGEQMFDAAVPTAGFMPRGRKVRSWGGKTWTETGHDLDRVWERDGVAYGVEIKNTLKYIPREELEAKLKMCKFLGLGPLFVMRFAPKSYIYEIAANWNH